jgi:hypothetical protein
LNVPETNPDPTPRIPTEFRRRYGGKGSPTVGPIDLGQSISYGTAARLTLEMAEKALGVQEDIRAEIQALRILTCLEILVAAGKPPAPERMAKLLEWVEAHLQGIG